MAVLEYSERQGYVYMSDRFEFFSLWAYHMNQRYAVLRSSQNKNTRNLVIHL